jgi:LysM repeat protein
MIRRFSLGLLACIFLGLLYIIAAPVKPAPVVAQADPASEIFQLINQFRASQGLPPFQYNGTLGAAAQAHANWMASTSIISHTGSGGSSPQTRSSAAGYTGYVVENIVGGTSMSPRQGLIWWQNSPIHYNTLVTGRYPQAGIGFGSNGGSNMYVLVVGRPPGASESGPQVSRPDISAAPLIITPIELAKPREDGSIVHVIRQGQAMWTIAAYYDVDLAYLYLINGLSEDDVLHPGYEVTVQLAEGQEPPPTPTPPLTYVIQDGDSAWSIALRNGIEIDFLYLLNNMTEDSVMHPGNEVVVRLAEGQAPPPTPTPKLTHTIRTGQSLWVIAALYDLTLDQLMELNNLTIDSVIRPGEELLIRLPTPTPPPTETPTPAPSATPTIALAVQSSPSPAAVSQRLTPVSTPDFEALARQDAAAAGTTTAIAILVGLGILAAAAVIIVLRQRT